MSDSGSAFGFTFGDEIAARDMVDRPDVVELACDNAPLRAALESMRPPNWWGSGAGADLLAIAREEYLPLSHVPPRAVIEQIAAGSSAEERLRLLTEPLDDVVNMCREALAGCTHNWIAEDVQLVVAALDALDTGHVAAGMALAVSVGEGLAVWASAPRAQMFWSRADRDQHEKLVKQGRRYLRAEIEQDRVGPDDFADPAHFLHQLLIAPIPRFFKPYWVDRDDPLPEHLSRHVVAHNPVPEHFTPTNAALAVLMDVGILCEQNVFAHEVEHDDATAEELGWQPDSL